MHDDAYTFWTTCLLWKASCPDYILATINNVIVIPYYYNKRVNSLKSISCGSDNNNNNDRKKRFWQLQ
jgi:hypothetical protein